MKNSKKNVRKHTPVQGKGVMRSSTQAMQNGVEPQGFFDILKRGGSALLKEFAG